MGTLYGISFTAHLPQIHLCMNRYEIAKSFSNTFETLHHFSQSVVLSSSFIDLHKADHSRSKISTTKVDKQTHTRTHTHTQLYVNRTGIFTSVHKNKPNLIFSCFNFSIYLNHFTLNFIIFNYTLKSILTRTRSFINTPKKHTERIQHKCTLCLAKKTNKIVATQIEYCQQKSD